ncbi:MAG: hypothetical protein ABW252_04080 [Polyangiales bacterium]
MRLATIALSLAALFTPLRASAQSALTPWREHVREQIDSERAGLGLDLNTFFGKAQGAGNTFFQPTVTAGARYREGVLEAALPFAYAHENHDPGDDGDRVALGNPWLALAYLPACECGLSRLSLGIAIDAASSRTALVRRVNALARGATGDWDGYLWIDRMLPLVLGASTRADIAKHVRLNWDGDVIFGLPAGTREFEIGTQHAVELAYVPTWHWQVSLRASAVWYPTFEGDRFQSSLGSVLRYVFVKDAIGARFVMNLDPPHGFAFTKDGMWGLGFFYQRSLGT